MSTETKGWLNVGATKSQIAFDCLSPLRTSFSKVRDNEDRLVHIIELLLIFARMVIKSW